MLSASMSICTPHDSPAPVETVEAIMTIANDTDTNIDLVIKIFKLIAKFIIFKLYNILKLVNIESIYLYSHCLYRHRKSSRHYKRWGLRRLRSDNG